MVARRGTPVGVDLDADRTAEENAVQKNPAGDAGAAPDGERPVAFLTWGLRGGAFANLTLALAGGLLAAGAGPVHVLYLRLGPGPRVQVPDGVVLVPLNVRRSITAPVAVARYIRRHRPRALVAAPTIVTLPALVGHVLAGRRRTSFVIYQGDTLASDVAIDHPTSLRLRLLPALARLLYPVADAMTTCAPGVLRALGRARIPIPTRTEVIANPVDGAHYRQLAAAPAAHEFLAVDRKGLVITTLGRLCKRKNHCMLVRAFAAVRAAGVDARLLIIGEGPERGNIENVVDQLGLAEFVALPGSIENPHAEIARSDLFVMSSLDEAFCLALVEAMACGVPVISTDAVGGGPHCILGAPAPDTRAASILGSALVPNGAEEVLADTMLRVLSDDDFRQRLAVAGRIRSDEFAPSVIGARWATFLDSVGQPL